MSTNLSIRLNDDVKALLTSWAREQRRNENNAVNYLLEKALLGSLLEPPNIRVPDIEGTDTSEFTKRLCMFFDDFISQYAAFLDAALKICQEKGTGQREFSTMALLNNGKVKFVLSWE